MATDISVASQALTLIRANPISSFSEDSNEAEILSSLYEPHIQNILSMHPWTFATKKRQLNQDAVAPIGEYTYAHIIPAEALLVWAVFSTDSVGASPISDYDIYGTDSARRIFSNYPILYADYVFRAPEAMWPAYFEKLAVVSTASFISVPVAGNAELADFYRQQAYGSLNSNMKGGLFGVAAAQDSKQKRNEYVSSSPLTSARFS